MSRVPCLVSRWGEAVSWGLIGNERAVAALERALGQGRAVHAYLFAGPARVGKHTLALKLAQALNCDGSEPPCDACQPCRRVAAGIHADVQTVTVEAAEAGREGEEGQQKGIHVSQVREIERATSLKPFEGRSRVVIFDPADEMNAAAQNAFLKTLEEPPPQVAFVLVTAQEERLLPTVRSRCRRLELRLPSLSQVESALVERGVEPERARLLARLSQGRIGWALEMAADGSRLALWQEKLQAACSLAMMGAAQRFELAERLANTFRHDREPVLGELEAWQEWWRDVLLVQWQAEEGVSNADMLAQLRQDASRHARAEVTAFVRALGAARRHLEENVQPRLVLEALLLQAPRTVEPARR